MSRFSTGRFLECQFIAVCRHTPLRQPVLRAYGSYLRATGAAGVQAKGTGAGDGLPEADANSRVIFSIRPPSNAVRGAVSCAWNVALGIAGGPLVGLAAFGQAWSGSSRGAFAGLCTGLVAAPMAWGTFTLLGVLCGMQQLAVGTYHQLCRPVFAVGLRRRALPDGSTVLDMRWWSPAASRFATPSAAPQSFVVGYRPNDEIMLEAMQRQSQRSQRSAARKGFESAEQDTQQGGKSAAASYYSVLGVERSATDREIRDAYGRLAMKLHPDKNPRATAHEEFDALTKAYRTLSNPTKRKKYDAAGVSGADDIGQKKRLAIRSFFGGDDLAALVGEVRRSNFNRRFIDEADFAAADLSVVNERLEDACVQHLLQSFLEAYPADGAGAEKDWITQRRRQLLQLASVALAREVMFVVGEQYGHTLDIVEAPGPAHRAAIIVHVLWPRNLRQAVAKVRQAVRLNPSMRDPAAILDFVWRLSVSELQQTAHRVALRVLLDEGASAEERARRAKGLRAFAGLLTTVGKPYTTVDKRTMDLVSASLRDYQQHKARKENS